MTAPFSPRVAELIKASMRHEVEATAVGVDGTRTPLVLEDLEVTFSEDWSPYVQGKVTVPVPPVEVLDGWDPRRNVRVEISAGYTYPDNVTELFPLADLGVRERPTTRPGNQVSLTLASDEARAQDYLIQWDPGVPKAGIKEAIAWLTNFSMQPEAPILTSSVGNGYGAAALAEFEAQIGDDAWSLMDDAADRVGLLVYCDGFRRWTIKARPEVAATPVHVLSVGREGTIISSQATLGRENWYNAAVLRYRWTPEGQAERIIYGRAAVTTGDLRPSLVGYKTYTEEINRPIGQAQADAVAAAKVRTLATRGRSMTLEAVAAYWLRPGHTVEVKLPTGEPELHLVQSIKFSPLKGSMSITTRQPLNIEIGTGE